MIWFDWSKHVFITWSIGAFPATIQALFSAAIILETTIGRQSFPTIIVRFAATFGFVAAQQANQTAISD
jgi:hypothetical protein